MQTRRQSFHQAVSYTRGCFQSSTKKGNYIARAWGLNLPFRFTQAEKMKTNNDTVQSSTVAPTNNVLPTPASKEELARAQFGPAPGDLSLGLSSNSVDTIAAVASALSTRPTPATPTLGLSSTSVSTPHFPTPHSSFPPHFMPRHVTFSSPKVSTSSSFFVQKPI